jgi:hypothetical protein
MLADSPALCYVDCDVDWRKDVESHKPSVGYKDSQTTADRGKLVVISLKAGPGVLVGSGLQPVNPRPIRLSLIGPNGDVGQQQPCLPPPESLICTCVSHDDIPRRLVLVQTSIRCL